MAVHGHAQGQDKGEGMTPFEAYVVSILNAVAIMLFSAVVFYITGQSWVWVFSLLALVPQHKFFMDKYGRKP